MSEYERGYREALEAAAHAVEHLGEMPRKRRWILRTDIVAAIRALAPRIPPALDGEALVEIVARVFVRQIPNDDKKHILATHNMTEKEFENDGWTGFSEDALEVVAALREAGALR